MIYTHDMHQRSMEVMHVYRILNNIITKVIRFTVGESAFESAARHEDGESEGVVISAGDIFAAAAVFAEWGASELACDNDDIGVQTLVVGVMHFVNLFVPQHGEVRLGHF